MIKLNNIGITYTKQLFNNINATLGNNEKVALVGLNGVGKSTLLKIIVGEENPDNGSIEIVNERVEYLPQEYNFKNELLVGEYLEELVTDIHTEMYKVYKILNKLGLDNIDIYREINTFSEGEKMKLYLTKLLINNPTVLLLDEPTNHLDITGIQWLENFIINFKGICIIISHDRIFLDNVSNKVFEIEEQKLNIYDGNYSDYLVQKEENILKRESQYVLQEKHREKLNDLLKRVSKISDGKRRKKAISSTKHRIEREVNRNEISRYKREIISKIQIEGSVNRSKQILKVKDLSFKYGSNEIFKDANYLMYGNEIVWFLGSNGIGKTTLVKLIINQLKPISGEIKIGDNLNWAYFSQDQSHINLNLTLEEAFLNGTGLTYSQSFGVMEKFLFTKDMRNMKVSKLSPGQRARLSFAIFSMKKYDFMILDEPTNHIDIQSKEIIEESLREYKGAILLVSHDRYFVQSVKASRGITIKDKKIVEIDDITPFLY